MSGVVSAVKSLAVAGLVFVAACAHATGPASLTGLDGKRQSFGDLVARAPLTVIVFVSATCPCMSAHQARLASLATTYGPRGVQVVAVDSEFGTTPESLAVEAREYGVPLLADEGARLADELGAEYATYTVIVDRAGHVHYRGGIDSDKRTLHPDAVAYVRDALDDLLAARPPRRPEGKALGCVLRRW